MSCSWFSCMFFLDFQEFKTKNHTVARFSNTSCGFSAATNSIPVTLLQQQYCTHYRGIPAIHVTGQISIENKPHLSLQWSPLLNTNKGCSSKKPHPLVFISFTCMFYIVMLNVRSVTFSIKKWMNEWMDGNHFFPGREEVFKQHRSAGCTGQTSHEIRDGWCFALLPIRGHWWSASIGILCGGFRCFGSGFHVCR